MLLVPNKTVFIGELLYFTTNLLVKLSIIFTLSRIVTTPAHRLTLYILAGSGFVVTIFTFFWAVFYCDPVRYFWTQRHDFALGEEGPAMGSDVSGSCKPISAVMAVVIVHASWTLIADLTLGLVLPVLILWSSQMRTRVKVSVGVLLGVGSVYVDISSLRSKIDLCKYVSPYPSFPPLTNLPDCTVPQSQQSSE
jgi:hypothetical protein